MNHILVETLMTTLILASIFMGAAFIFFQKQGQSFIASFDKAIAWGLGLFVIGSSLSTVTFVL